MVLLTKEQRKRMGQIPQCSTPNNIILHISNQCQIKFE